MFGKHFSYIWDLLHSEPPNSSTSARVRLSFLKKKDVSERKNAFTDILVDM